MGNILFNVKEKKAYITVNRPEKRNPMDNLTMGELNQALAFTEANPEIKVLIITGAGDKSFVAGADINELALRNNVTGREETRTRQGVYNRIERLNIPSIAAINGYALGGGLELAMACTFRIAARTAIMGLTEVDLGVIPAAGGTQRLPRLVGLGRAMEMILTGKKVSAEEAFDMGLVNLVTDPGQVMQEVEKLAIRLIGLPKLALQYAKEAVLNHYEVPFSAGLSHESYLHTLACVSEDKNEGTLAFLEKRKPQFKDR